MTNGESVSGSRRVLITGGTSFIGSNLADRLSSAARKCAWWTTLPAAGWKISRPSCKAASLTFIEADLREPGVTRMAMQGIQTVFHLAADHGGRGYVDLHQAGPASNFFLDGLVFGEAVKAGVRKLFSRLRAACIQISCSPIPRKNFI